MNLIVTVSAALTQPVKLELAFTLALGTPMCTASPSAAPVTVIVRSALLWADVLEKSKVAVAVSVLARVYTVVPDVNRRLSDTWLMSPSAGDVGLTPSMILSDGILEVPAFRCNAA